MHFVRGSKHKTDSNKNGQNAGCISCFASRTVIASPTQKSLSPTTRGKSPPLLPPPPPLPVPVPAAAPRLLSAGGRAGCARARRSHPPIRSTGRSLWPDKRGARRGGSTLLLRLGARGRELRRARLLARPPGRREGPTKSGGGRGSPASGSPPRSSSRGPWRAAGRRPRRSARPAGRRPQARRFW